MRPPPDGTRVIQGQILAKLYMLLEEKVSQNFLSGLLPSPPPPPPCISIYNLKKHVTIAHSDEEWLCDSCPKKFTNTLSLRRHRATHAEKRLPCHICAKVFRSSSNLRQHMLAHSDRRPFVCHTCQSGS